MEVFLLLLSMRLALRKISSIILLLVFFIETTPDALLHLLTNHEDTHDAYSSESVIGIKHVHCQALQILFPAFSLKDSVSIPEVPIIVVLRKFPSTSVYTSSVFIIKQGRGPPPVA